MGDEGEDFMIQERPVRTVRLCDVFDEWACFVLTDLQKNKFWGKIEITYQGGKAIKAESRRLHLPKDFGSPDDK